ncbi:MAG: FAD-binding protein [Chloroflexota bacterium]|nr:FAD-binding protein [Chloroflexota bacterium]MCY3581886.1 FAD-binding protein [Chloroflexota bacterium]MDE2650740.1 FAD-binding protein [Chloroflexota bacterium]MXV92712.1 FAD-binding protein [Chloroflexota bacterium]MXX82558.1 FAD-binding protein [Chloroflexota bacterium]
MNRRFLGALSKIYPGERLLTRDVELLPYESDALTAFQTKPGAVVLPENADEVIATVRLCHEHSVPFVARGSGTSLSGGSLPIADGLTIALNRLNRIKRIDPQQRIAVVEPGVVNLHISQAAQPFGLYYAPDPSSQSICTIGGNIAFNSGGAHCLKYGMTSNHVLGMKVALADGSLTEFGGESLDGCGIGPDLVGLFVGSEGLFGIALEMTLRLLPIPELYRTVLAAFDDLGRAGDAVSRVVASGLLPGAIEIMDRLAIRAAETVGANYPDAEALLIVELEGEALQVEAEFTQLRELIEDSGAFEIRTAQNEDERARIWKGRKSAFSAVGRLSPDYIVQDGVVPRSRLGEALSQINALKRSYGLEVANVFHAGDGNLHPLILFDGREAGALRKAEALAGEILAMCVELGGSITGEHGVGVEKRDYMPAMFSEAELDIMLALRQAIDPREIANRGKMFPSGEAPALKMQGMHPLERQGLISRE